MFCEMTPAAKQDLPGHIGERALGLERIFRRDRQGVLGTDFQHRV